MPSWKAAQSKRQKNKRTKLALIILGIFFGILILAQIFKFAQTLFSPWQIKNPAQRNYNWNGGFNITIVVKDDKVSLLSFSPKNQTATILEIPDNTFLETAHGFGNWQIRSIYDLGGHQLLKDSLGQFFGLPVDAFLEGEFLESIKENPIFSLTSISDIKTDLSLVELIRLKMGLFGVRFDKIHRIDLEESGALSPEKLADGTDILIADPTKLDSEVSDLVDPNLESEHKTIAIFNATDHPQMAQKAARIITNIGGDVIITSNSESKLEKTQIFGEESKTLERLKQIFGASGKIDPAKEDQVPSRAQINIFLGEDFYNNL